MVTEEMVNAGYDAMQNAPKDCGWNGPDGVLAHVYRAMLAARPAPSEPVALGKLAPLGYAHRYPHYSGGTAVHFGTHGREINGSKPIEAIPLYTAEQVTTALAATEAQMRDTWNEAIEAAIIAAIQAPGADRKNASPHELHGRDMQTIAITAAIRSLRRAAAERTKL